MARDWAPDFVRNDDQVLWLDDDNAIGFIEDSEGKCGGTLFHRRNPPLADWPYCAGGFYWRQPVTYRDKITPWQERKVTLWQLESIDPLTLSPSILCNCGHHGFIKQGKWIQA